MANGTQSILDTSIDAFKEALNLVVNLAPGETSVSFKVVRLEGEECARLLLTFQGVSSIVFERFVKAAEALVRNSAELPDHCEWLDAVIEPDSITATSCKVFLNP